MIVMQKTITTCPTQAEWDRFAGGHAAAGEADQLAEHLESCQPCQQRLESATPIDDWLIRELRPASDMPAASETSEPECLEAMLHVVRHCELPATWATGEQVGPYQLLRPLGVGGMGTVYLARHTRLQREVAIKLLPRMHGKSPSTLQRFDREMTAVAALEHPHIVRATDAGEANGWHYLVMEYLDGMDLSRLSRRLGRLHTADACQLVLDAAAGLTQLHHLGWVHRDVKPSNLMLTREGRTKLVDLGLVLSDETVLAQQHRLTTVGHLMGTVAYMAPEQLIDSAAVDARADIYALAATLFRLLTAVDPHPSGANLPATILAKTTDPARPIRSILPELSAPLAELIDESLASSRDARPDSMQAFADRLNAHTDGAETRKLIRGALRMEVADETEATSQAAAFPSAKPASPLITQGEPKKPTGPPHRWLKLSGGRN